MAHRCYDPPEDPRERAADDRARSQAGTRHPLYRKASAMKSMKVPLLWRLPKAAMTASIRELALVGARRCEGVALWLGHRFAGLVSVTEVVALRGPGISKR